MHDYEGEVDDENRACGFGKETDCGAINTWTGTYFAGKRHGLSK